MLDASCCSGIRSSALPHAWPPLIQPLLQPSTCFCFCSQLFSFFIFSPSNTSSPSPSPSPSPSHPLPTLDDQAIPSCRVSSISLWTTSCLLSSPIINNLLSSFSFLPFSHLPSPIPTDGESPVGSSLSPSLFSSFPRVPRSPPISFHTSLPPFSSFLTSFFSLSAHPFLD